MKKKKHPSHTEMLPRLKRVQGQIAGIAEMIENQRYCADILMQLKAARSAIKSIEAGILKTHLNHCVKDVFVKKSGKEIEHKIEEILQLLSKEN